MKKGKIIGLIIIFILVVFGMTTVFSEVFSYKTYGEDVLINLFEKSGANIFETNIYTSLYINDQYFEIEEMLEILDTFLIDLELNSVIEKRIVEEYNEEKNEEPLDFKENTLYITTLSESEINKIYCTYLDNNSNLTTFIVYSMKYEDEIDSYIIIDILQNKSYKDMVSLLNKGKDFMIKFGNNIDTTITLVGTYNERLTTDEANKKMMKLLRAVNGKVVDEVADDFFTTITAYTPQIKEYIQFFNKRVNLNMAIRYNSYEDLTYLWIATPLITTSY